VTFWQEKFKAERDLKLKGEEVIAAMRVENVSVFSSSFFFFFSFILLPPHSIFS